MTPREPKNWIIHWHIVNFTDDQEKYKTILALEKAFAFWWRELYPIQFKSTQDATEAQILIHFAQDFEKYWKSNDVLAFGQFPVNGNMIVFNDKKTWWDMWKPWQYELLNTATHEIGHSLWLYHTKDKNDIMYTPFYKDRPLAISDKTKTALRVAYKVIQKNEIERWKALVASTIKPYQIILMSKSDKEFLANILGCEAKAWPIMRKLYP